MGPRVGLTVPTAPAYTPRFVLPRSAIHMVQNDLEPSGERPGVRLGEGITAIVADRFVRIPIRSILEVMDPAAVTQLPGSPPAVRGITSYRGSPATVVDLGIAMGHRQEEAGERLIVLRWRTHLLALRVDRVRTVTDDAGSSPAEEMDLDGILEQIF